MVFCFPLNDNSGFGFFTYLVWISRLPVVLPQRPTSACLLLPDLHPGRSPTAAPAGLQSSSCAESAVMWPLGWRPLRPAPFLEVPTPHQSTSTLAVPWPPRPSLQQGARPGAWAGTCRIPGARPLACGHKGLSWSPSGPGQLRCPMGDESRRREETAAGCGRRRGGACVPVCIRTCRSPRRSHLWVPEVLQAPPRSAPGNAATGWSGSPEGGLQFGLSSGPLGGGVTVEK